MKRWLVIAVGALLVLAGVAVLWPRSDGAQTRTESPQLQRTEPLPEFEQVEVASATPSSLALTGVVKDAAGNPVPGAEVSLAAAAQGSLVTLRCGICEEQLLSCAAHQSAHRVRDVLQAGRGALMAGARTSTDETGRFRFENLSGVSFTVWAQAPGLGAAIHERAAPGDPVELFLPPLRALAGVVTDETGAPVGGARVHVVSRRLALPMQTQTQADGVFEAAGLGEGPFYVLVDAPGYLPVAEHRVEAGPQPVRIRLQRPRVLEVEVRRNGEPVEATVLLSGDHLEHSAPVTKGFGQIGELWPDELLVSATGADDSASTPQRVMLTEAVTRVRLELEAAGRISVTIVDEAGQPVPTPKVSLVRGAESEPIVQRKAGTGELVVLGPVAHGQYTVIAEADGHQPAELPVRVDRGETQVELVMMRGTYIRGRVLDEYGRPAPRISVLVLPTGETVLADENGHFSVTVASPGFYELQAHHSDWGGGEAKVTAPAEGVELHLEPKAGLRVTVTSDGRRLEGADVLLWVERSATWRNDRPSGSDGIVLMRGMPPGTYSMVASHRDHLMSKIETVTLRDGELIDIAVTLEKGEVLSGQVTDELGAPVSGASVSAMPRGVEPALTDASGRFELRPVRGARQYRLEAMHPAFDQKKPVIATGGDTSVEIVLQRRNTFRGRVLTESGEPMRSFFVEDREVTSADGRFELPLPTEDGRVFAVIEARGYQPHMLDAPGDVRDVGDIVLHREPQVSGRVVDEAGGPVEGAVVSCDVCDSHVTSSADGRFSLSVPPHLASFTVSATRGGLKGTSSASSRSGQVVEVVLRNAVQVTGRVFLTDGNPAAGVEIEAVNVELADAMSAVTMQDGSYTLALPEGSYRFTLPGLQRPFSGDPVVFATVRGTAASLDFGAAPGSGTLTVQLAPAPGHALWLVRGSVPAVGNPPMELFKSEWAQMVYQPRASSVVLSGIPAGRYTLIWTRFHAQSEAGPVITQVDVPGPAEVSLVPPTR